MLINTDIDLENVSLPICTWQHLCKTAGCSNDHKVSRFCHCNGAYTFYDDCCIDYKDTCWWIWRNEEILASRNIHKADMECITLDSGGNDFIGWFPGVAKILTLSKKDARIHFVLILNRVYQLQTWRELLLEMFRGGGHSHDEPAACACQ